jgi:hypothetical protein
MSDTYQQPEAPVPSSVPSGLGVMQFSLTGLFVLMTVSALLVAVYFGVGRLVGMSTAEILTMGFARLSLTLPVVLVWAVGFTLALRRLDRNPSTASLTMIALGGMFLTLLVVNVSQMAVLHLLRSSQISGDTMSRSMMVIAIGYTVLNTVWWILILVAIFARRPPHSAVSQPMSPQKPQDAL